MKEDKRIITIEVLDDKVESLGALEYNTVPLKGDWVAHDIDGQGYMFEVVQVAHGTRKQDLYVKRLGTTTKAIQSLYRK